MTLNNQSNDSEILKRAGGNEVARFMEGHGFHLTQTEANSQGYWFKEIEPQMTIGFVQAKAMYSILQDEILKARLDEAGLFIQAHAFYNDGCSCCSSETIGEWDDEIDKYGKTPRSVWAIQRLNTLQSQLTKSPKEKQNDEQKL